MSQTNRDTNAPAKTARAFKATNKTKGEPMTEKQAAYLRHLCEKWDEPFTPNLNRVQAQNRINALRGD